MCDSSIFGQLWKKTFTLESITPRASTSKVITPEAITPEASTPKASSSEVPILNNITPVSMLSITDQTSIMVCISNKLVNNPSNECKRAEPALTKVNNWCQQGDDKACKYLEDLQSFVDTAKSQHMP